MQNQNNLIVGIGTDVVQIDRIEKLYNKFGEKFLYKNYHELEIIEFQKLGKEKKHPFLAKRFAGKEAISKAFGLGIGSKISFKDIAIVNNSLGAPIAKILSKSIDDLDNYCIHISLSDDYPIALAFALVTR
jgi:holo-[acyl-carrier protein] synthase